MNCYKTPSITKTKRLAQTKYLVVANSDLGYRQHIRSKKGKKQKRYPAGRSKITLFGHPVTRKKGKRELVGKVR
jgi:hypothetical protein